jgi:segregation and condensation protein B
MKILLNKNFIHVIGKKDVPGKPWQYSTTKDFLLHFGLKTLQELPSPGPSNLN